MTDHQCDPHLPAETGPVTQARFLRMVQAVADATPQEHPHVVAGLVLREFNDCQQCMAAVTLVSAAYTGAVVKAVDAPLLSEVYTQLEQALDDVAKEAEGD